MKRISISSLPTRQRPRIQSKRMVLPDHFRDVTGIPYINSLPTKRHPRISTRQLHYVNPYMSIGPKTWVPPPFYSQMNTEGAKKADYNEAKRQSEVLQGLENAGIDTKFYLADLAKQKGKNLRDLSLFPSSFTVAMPPGVKNVEDRDRQMSAAYKIYMQNSAARETKLKEYEHLRRIEEMTKGEQRKHDLIQWLSETAELDQVPDGLYIPPELAEEIEFYINMLGDEKTKQDLLEKLRTIRSKQSKTHTISAKPMFIPTIFETPIEREKRIREEKEKFRTEYAKAVEEKTGVKPTKEAVERAVGTVPVQPLPTKTGPTQGMPSSGDRNNPDIDPSTHTQAVMQYQDASDKASSTPISTLTVNAAPAQKTTVNTEPLNVSNPNPNVVQAAQGNNPIVPQSNPSQITVTPAKTSTERVVEAINKQNAATAATAKPKGSVTDPVVIAESRGSRKSINQDVIDDITLTITTNEKIPDELRYDFLQPILTTLIEYKGMLESNPDEVLDPIEIPRKNGFVTLYTAIFGEEPDRNKKIDDLIKDLNDAIGLDIIRYNSNADSWKKLLSKYTK